MYANKWKLLITPGIVILLLLPVLNQWMALAFFFEAGRADYQNWFPHFSFLAFAFFKSFYPLVYAVGLYVILREKLSALSVLLLIIIQSVIIFWTLQAVGFTPVALYAYVLVLLGVIFLTSGFIKTVYFTFIKLISNSKLITGSFLFVIYIVLCLMLNRFHPFAKYTMFNKFEENTNLFLLRGTNDSLLPLNAYCTIDGNHLFELYVAMNNKHRFRYGNGYTNIEQQQMVSAEMMQIIFATLKKPVPADSVKLMRVNFYFENGKLKSNELQVYACRVE